MIAGLIHWTIVSRSSRYRPDASASTRLLPFGVGSWHLGVLRRSWFPENAGAQHRWAVMTYSISVGAGMVVFLLLVNWVL